MQNKSQIDRSVYRRCHKGSVAELREAMRAPQNAHSATASLARAAPTGEGAALARHRAGATTRPQRPEQLHANREPPPSQSGQGAKTGISASRVGTDGTGAGVQTLHTRQKYEQQEPVWPPTALCTGLAPSRCTHCEGAEVDYRLSERRAARREPAKRRGSVLVPHEDLPQPLRSGLHACGRRW